MIKSLTAFLSAALVSVAPIVAASAAPTHRHDVRAETCGVAYGVTCGMTYSVTRAVATHSLLTDSLLTVDILNNMTAFWTAFMNEPANITGAGRQAHQKPLTVDVGGGQSIQLSSVIDMVGMAAAFPAVAKDLADAHLTAQQWEHYRLLLFQVDVASWTPPSSATYAAVRMNGDFTQHHQREINALGATGMWFPTPQTQGPSGPPPPPQSFAQVQAQDQAQTAQFIQYNVALGPWLSPRDTSKTTVGHAHVLIDYGRPSMAGRPIFGSLVPYGQVWRTGANMATTLVTDKDLMIGTLAVPAGSYTLFTIPTKQGWQLILNKENGQWGLTYRPEYDLGTTTMTVSTTKAPVEKFLIDFTKDHKLRMQWEHTVAEVQITEKQ